MATNKVQNPEEFRSNIKTHLGKLIDASEEQLHFAINLEKGIYNYAIKEATSRKIVKKWDNTQFVQLYIDRLRSVYLNLLNKEKCADLILGIKSGEIPAQTVAFMTHQEFAPHHWRRLIEKKIKRDASRFNTNIEASTDMFTCKKCRSKRCTYYELQTRSADEPATIFITCLDCGKNWKN
jgi:transcription elongation factor S-II